MTSTTTAATDTYERHTEAANAYLLDVTTGGWVVLETNPTVQLALAQIHATLALAEATRRNFHCGVHCAALGC
jgi:hypothetical protein